MTVRAFAQAGETVDLICWRMLGRTQGVAEQVLELNPGLAALGPMLPENTAVILPDTAAATPVLRETIQLWS